MTGARALFWLYVVMPVIGIALYTVVGLTHN
jgi:hypothetical protein